MTSAHQEAESFIDMKLEETEPATSVEGFQSRGTLYFLLLILILTGAHLLFVYPRTGGATITGVLYTIAVVSLSPILFFTLLRPMGPAEFRFVASYLAIFTATAPVFYYPRFIGAGLAAALVFGLAAILPPIFRDARLKRQLKQLESSDPLLLLRALDSSQPSLRVSARLKLLELGEKAVKPIINHYRKLRNDQVRMQMLLAELLVELAQPPLEGGAPSAAMAELALFWKQQIPGCRDPELLRLFLLGVAKQHDTQMAGTLLDLLKVEQARGKRVDPARDLYIDALVAAAVAVAAELYKLHADSGEGLKVGRDLTSRLLKLHMASPGPERFNAIASLGAPLVPAIATQLENAPNLVRRELTRLLGALGALAAVPLLLELTGDSILDVRACAMRSLLSFLPDLNATSSPTTELPPPLHKQVIDVFVRHAYDAEAGTRNPALLGLSIAGGKETQPLLLEYLSTPLMSGEDLNLRGSVAANLARSGDPELLEPLLDLVRQGTSEVVAGAARGLGYFKDARATSALRGLLENPEAQVSLCAAIGLARQGDDSGRALLANALIEIDNPNRFDALEALGMIPDMGFLQLLEAGLLTPMAGWSNRERVWSIQRLIDLQVQEARAILQRLWESEELLPETRQLMQPRLAAAGLLSPTGTFSAKPAAASTPPREGKKQHPEEDKKKVEAAASSRGEGERHRRFPMDEARRG